MSSWVSDRDYLSNKRRKPSTTILSPCHHLRRRDPLEGTRMDRPNSPEAGLITTKDWTLEHLLAAGVKFREVDRISVKSRPPEQIAATIKDYEQRNVPLVVEDFHCNPDWPEFFTPQWLESHYGSQGVFAPKLVQASSTHVLRFSG